MISIRIGEDTRSFEDASESWINQQINRRRRDGSTVCVTVQLKDEGLDMTLRTPTCGIRGGGGGRAPNRQETRIFRLWEKHHMDTAKFTGGNLIGFLRDVERL